MKYFDYAATTPSSDSVLDEYVRVSKEVFGNPGSSDEARELEAATRALILDKLNMRDTHKLIFTSGGTEANNLAILGNIKKRIEKGSHMITSNFEHASVYDVFVKLSEGNRVDFCPSTKDGQVDVLAFKKLLRPSTKFVSIMHVNNELGTEQPIEELYKITKNFNEEIIFMVDTVQGLGKVKPLSIKPDVLTISSHKIYGPKSVGAVIVNRDLVLTNMISGGTKESGQRAGTQSLPAQAGFALAVENIVDDLDQVLAKVDELRDYLESQLATLDYLTINAKSDSNVVSVFIDVDENAIQNIKKLKARGFAISAKSADSNNAYAKSRSLKAIGLSDYRCDRTFRISLSHHKTIQDIDELIDALREIISESNHSKLLVDVDGNDYCFTLRLNDIEIGRLKIEKTETNFLVTHIEVYEQFEKRNFAHILMQKTFEHLACNEMDYFVCAPIEYVEFFNTLGFKQFGQVRDNKQNMMRMFD